MGSVRHEFNDKQAASCKLYVDTSSDFTDVAITGWNYGNNDFTSIDFDREELRNLINVLVETLGAMDARAAAESNRNKEQ